MNKNTEKQARYATLKGKLKRALAGKFWLEACMIEYAIIEDRTSAILHHAKVCKDAYSDSKRLANKLNSIEYQIGKRHQIISRKVNPNTIAQIRTWKEERNNLVHRSCTLYDEEKAKGIAQEGKRLVDAISNDSAKVTRMAIKLEMDSCVNSET